MKKDIRYRRKTKQRIRKIEETSDRLTGRAGLSFFVSYLHGIAIFEILERLFGSIRKNKKGLLVSELFKQMLCFFMDGSSRRLTRLDQLKKDDGYSGTIETETSDMASSHQVKRFYKSFSFVRIFLFRRLLQTLFIWRLKIVQPKVIELGIDTMVMDNDDAECRHGVKPTYKKKKGFQPLQMNWGRLFVDAVFRSGDKHSNHGETVQKMIQHMVSKIRKEYRKDVPIIIRMDSGFFDQKIFHVCESLGIGYVCGGKMYSDIVKMAAEYEETGWKRFQSKKKDRWQFIEFGSKRGNWKRFRRAIYCRLMHNDRNQLLLPGFRPDTVIITNIGQNQAIDGLLAKAGMSDYLNAHNIVAVYHERGSDELANRALKDFGHEQLPFKQFSPNAAWYYTMLTAHFLFETFKEDVTAPVISIGSYASTVRRRLIDIAGKIVSHGRETVLKVSKACIEDLKLFDLFVRCQSPPPIV